MKNSKDDYLDLKGYFLPDATYSILSLIAFCGIGKLLFMIITGEFG